MARILPSRAVRVDTDGRARAVGSGPSWELCVYDGEWEGGSVEVAVLCLRAGAGAGAVATAVRARADAIAGLSHPALLRMRGVVLDMPPDGAMIRVGVILERPARAMAARWLGGAGGNWWRISRSDAANSHRYW